MPVIGFLSTKAPDDTPRLLAAFREGLKDAGFVEGQNLTIEYRFANNQNERLPGLAADLVRRQVAVICRARYSTGSSGQGSDQDHSNRL